jgi:hypothetical protein
VSVTLEELLQRPKLWRGADCALPARPGLPTSFAGLDAALPGGGWPQGALTEILCGGAGIGELSLVLPALARLTQQGRQVLWVTPPFLPYAPALRPAEALWAAEQALRSGICGAVFLWPNQPSFRELRRLQLAAETGGHWAVVYRPAEASGSASPAPLRLSVEAAKNRLLVRILKRRGGSVAGPVLLDIGRLDRPGGSLSDAAGVWPLVERSRRSPCLT